MRARHRRTGRVPASALPAPASPESLSSGTTSPETTLPETVFLAPPEPPRPSPHAGMGAVLLPDGAGASFRVWAPHARAVAVTGSFGASTPAVHPLAAEEGGFWSGVVPAAADGHRYRFALETADGQVLERRDPYARDLDGSTGHCVVVDAAFDWGDESAYRTPPWNEMVIYEVHVGTFNDTPGDAPGNFDGVVEKLPYLRDLGINAIELMPTSEFAHDYSWGYNPAYLFAPESAFGGPRELKRLVKEAHAHGIAVILDVVYNHLGPDDLDLWRFDGWGGVWEGEETGGIWFYNDRRARTPWGHTRPDYGREPVRAYLRENARVWLEEFRMDGLRWDATAYVRNVHGHDAAPHDDIPDGWSLMQEVNRQTDERQPWKLQVAEDLRNNAWITRPADAGGAGFDTQWDGEFVHPVRRALVAPTDEGRDMHEVARALAHRYGGDPLKRVVYTESHDEVANGRARVPEEVWPGNAASWPARKRATLGAALVLTAPGIPMLFQGQEFLEDRWFHDTDPLEWWRTETYAGIVRMHRDLIRLRRNWLDHTRGLRGPHVHVHHVNDADKVLAFHRWEAGGARDDVVVVANFANRAFPAYRVGFPRAGLWRVRFNSDWIGYDPEFGAQDSWNTHAEALPLHGMPARADVGIGPYTVVILSQDA